MVKIVTIAGATGAQGKGAARAFLNDPAYHVRAITRNPSSAAAQVLASQGAEVVSADLNDEASLQAAFAGSHILFGVTNFFEPFAAHQSAAKAMEVEAQQGLNLARAAAATPTLECYIWSTLPNAADISGGKYVVPHFEGKNRVDAYIRQNPDLLRKTTFLWVTCYHSNLAFPMMTPYFISTAGKYLQFGSYSASTPLENIGDVSLNLAPFVRAAVEQRDKAGHGGIVLAASERLSAGDLLQLWARVKGVEAQFVRVGRDDFNAIWPMWAEEIGLMMGFWDEFRETAWTDPSGQRVLTKEDLGVQRLQTLEEAYKTLEL